MTTHLEDLLELPLHKLTPRDVAFVQDQLSRHPYIPDQELGSLYGYPKTAVSVKVDPKKEYPPSGLDSILAKFKEDKKNG